MFTDKLVAKIPSTSNGVIKEIKYEVDDVCLVGHTLLTITVEAEEDGSSSEAAEIQYGETQTVQNAGPNQIQTNKTPS